MSIPGNLDNTEMVLLPLAHRPPFDWAAMVAYLSARAIPGIEAVILSGAGQYWRSVRLHGYQGYIVIAYNAAPRETIQLGISATLLPALVPLLARVRRLLDLDADPVLIAAHLAGDPLLAPLVARRPGLRMPGAVDGFELALRAVLGQQVTVRWASTLAGRLAEFLAEPLLVAARDGSPSVPITRLPLEAGLLAEASIESLTSIGLPRARAHCIRALAQAVAAGELPELESDVPIRDPDTAVRRLREIPGIGDWTASYIVMRALGWPDAFPEGDLGLRKAMGGLSAARLRAAAE